MRKLAVIQSAVAAAIAAVFPGVSNLAFAGSFPANLNVSAQVNANCTMTTTPVDFGPYDPLSANASTALLATGSVSITCTKGTSATIDLSLGGNPNAGVRQMSDGTKVLPYQLFQPVGATCPNTTEWGSGTASFAAGPAPSKAQRTFNVCGRIAAGIDAEPGNYADVVNATVNF